MTEPVPELTSVQVSYSNPLLIPDDGVVEPRSGRLSLTVTDLLSPAGAVQLAIERSLQTAPRKPGLLGSRWRLNWERRLLRTSEQAMIDEPSGTVIFTRSGGEGRYRSSSGEQLVVDAGRAS